MRIAGYLVHPAAGILPLMSRAALKALAGDIKLNGLLNPIVLVDGKILDGRNRLLACKRARLKPKFVEWKNLGTEWKNEDRSPVAWVLSANLARRHLTKSQQAVVAARSLPLFEAEARERQRQAARITNQKLGRGKKTVPAFLRSASSAGTSASHAAEALGVSSRYIEQAKRVLKEAPHLEVQIQRGDLTLNGALRAITRSKQLAAIESYTPPKGKYPIIVVDPPWRYWKDDEHYREGAPDYPTMSVEDLCRLEIPAAADCILWVWTTNSMMRHTYTLLDAWGFTAKTILTWDKGHHRLGVWLRGRSEHCILATRGKPIIALRNQSTIIRERSRQHSRKPESFYALVDSLCPQEPKLELFARRRRPGWVSSGAEVGLVEEGGGRTEQRLKAG